MSKRPSAPKVASLADLFAQARAVVAADSRWDCPDGAPAWPSFLPAAGLPTVRSRDGRVLSEAADATVPASAAGPLYAAPASVADAGHASRRARPDAVVILPPPT